MATRTLIRELSLREIGSQALTQALHQFRSKGPSIRAFDQSLLRQVQICLDDGSHDPKYLFIGPENIAAKVYGPEFCAEAVGAAGLPDKNFIDPLHARYAEASWLQQPTLDYVSGKCADYFVQYQRLIVPVESDKARCFACFISPERMVHAPPSGPKVARFESLSTDSNHPHSQASAPI